VNGALFKRMKRNALAANALFGTPEWVEPDMRFFMASEEWKVTRNAALVEECLDDARAHAKRKGWRPIPLEFLPSGILESKALEPYLKRWKRDDAAAAAAAAAAPTRALRVSPDGLKKSVVVCLGHDDDDARVLLLRLLVRARQLPLHVRKKKAIKATIRPPIGHKPPPLP
jgi:hypothetical protein